MVTTATIPIIDFADWRSGQSGAKARLALQIADACRTVGFFYVVNHGAPPALCEAQLTWAARFFNLPLAEKQTVELSRSPVRRGYDPMATQTLQKGMQPDMKEAYALGRDLAAEHWLLKRAAPFEGPNLWPESSATFDGEGFRRQMEAYRDAMTALGLELSSLLALSLDLPDDYFAESLQDPNVNVRLLHYPPQPKNAAADQLGCGAHTDWGLLTVLLQDDCGGLEIEKADGAWISATPMPGALIVNLGDMVVRLTAGRYASNVHRVINAAPERGRYSVATFFNPHALYQVECVPTCRSAAPPLPPLTFGDHIQAMIEKTYQLA
jgi:isopenicillin N synthase-like dioxygenase